MTTEISPFLQRLAEGGLPLLADGAMGTEINQQGVGFNRCFDELNLTQPERIAAIHRKYVQAGAQVIQTNTFGANRFKLALHGLQGKVKEINRAGAALAREAVDGLGAPAMIAGDIGPLGVRLAPYGRVTAEQARQAFTEQVQALCEAGIDLIILETFSDLNEMLVALEVARQACSLPVVASLTYTRDDRTLLGESPTAAAHKLHEMKTDLIGVNCSGGPEQVLRILREMRRAVPEAHFSAMPNAGWPQQAGGRVMYPAGPTYFGNFAPAFRNSGAILIGGCCGTTPQHIAAMRAALDQVPVEESFEPGSLAIPLPTNGIQAEEQPSQLARKLAAGKFVISVEVDPPRGLSTHALLAGASLLAEAGADVINVADSPRARMRMSPWAVCNLIQRRFGLETVLHFPTRGRNLLRVQGDLLAAHALDIRNVFVVMGDPTEIGDYPDAMDEYDVVPSGLIRLIKQGFNSGLDHAGAEIGEPTAFFAGCALNLTAPEWETEAKKLRRKVQAGADFVLSQPVFQPEAARVFLDRYAERYGPLEVPILAGVLPLTGPRHAAFLHNEVPGITIPDEVHRRLQSAGASAPQEGVRLAIELAAAVRSWASGIYLMPAFNRYGLAAEIIEVIKTWEPEP